MLFSSFCICCLVISLSLFLFFFFFFNDTATTEIYTLSLHDALPISGRSMRSEPGGRRRASGVSSGAGTLRPTRDRKSTRLNSSHGYISYAVFCLKKKKKPRRKTQCRKHYIDHIQTIIRILCNTAHAT